MVSSYSRAPLALLHIFALVATGIVPAISISCAATAKSKSQAKSLADARLLQSDAAGALSSYEWLSETMVGDAAVRDRGKRLCRMIVGSDLLSLPLVFSLCRRFISGWLMLIIRMCCGDYPDVYALPASFALPWI
uniref:Uncharacterized protein n=1 Tax=Vitis vinifera TaxID=29760 RepID=A5CAI2_VITVI|nr:hypothetical protein VITISV_014429 [Vitis vinifera]